MIRQQQEKAKTGPAFDLDFDLEAARNSLRPHVRDVVRQEIGRSGVSQRSLAERMGMSQSTLSHALMGRSYEPTPTEIWTIEVVLGLRLGTIYRRCGLVDEPTVEELVRLDEKIHPAAADTIVGAIRHARTRGERMREGVAMAELNEREPEAHR